jgi:hypothetical protein
VITGIAGVNPLGRNIIPGDTVWVSPSFSWYYLSENIMDEEGLI